MATESTERITVSNHAMQCTNLMNQLSGMPSSGSTSAASTLGAAAA
eukprot:CAMPEP_0180664070 /NCGR_PEP_ID=MMETSP1037_2-20121125/60388_1 /TAXON_ID=632150 /ORGANISM="Azadinium spinosum, Strain 3D9" /LENGTH=45 /DNA_ID= /DNA_START= /DNA_END= /DNA_ORIENTATION=